jgi:DNA polymerase-4
MKGMGLHTGADLKKLEEEALIKHFGKAGKFYYGIVRGIDERPVKPDREIKSVAAEDTFAYDLTLVEEMNTAIDTIASIVSGRLQKNELSGRTITLKIKYSDFKQITRSLSFLQPVNDLQTIAGTCKQLLFATNPGGTKIRLLGISLSNFKEQVQSKRHGMGQLSLFDSNE